MKTTSELLGSLRSELPEQLGPDFEMLEDTAAAAVRSLGRSDGVSFGDVLIRKKDSNDLIIVEVKGSEAEDQLPLGVLPAMRRAKGISPSHSKIVLVSTSTVSPRLRQALQAEGIAVVEKPSTARVAAEIRNIANAELVTIV
jgi:hypothetical protein